MNDTSPPTSRGRRRRTLALVASVALMAGATIAVGAAPANAAACPDAHTGHYVTSWPFNQYVISAQLDHNCGDAFYYVELWALPDSRGRYYSLGRVAASPVRPDGTMSATYYRFPYQIDATVQLWSADTLRVQLDLIDMATLEVSTVQDFVFKT